MPERSSRLRIPRPVQLALAVISGALLACSGSVGGAGLGYDTGDPLVIAFDAHEGSGDGSGDGLEQPVPAGTRPSLMNKLAQVRRSPLTKAGDPSKDAHPRAERKPSGTDAPSPGAAEPERLRGVRQTGDDSWNVRQRVVDRWQDDPQALANADAHGDGWMLRRARRGDAHFLGMKNKDVILSVNGRKLKTQTQLLAAYLALKNKKSFEVVFQRNGKQHTHHYKIRD